MRQHRDEIFKHKHEKMPFNLRNRSYKSLADARENGYIISCVFTLNRLLGSFVKFGGGILGLAGEVAKHAGNLIYSSGRSYGQFYKILCFRFFHESSSPSP
jgi:hypothetical protein